MVSGRCSLMAMGVVLLLISYSSVSEANALIDQICRQTDDFRFCSNVFNQHVFTPSPNAKDLCQVALTQTLLKASDTVIFIRASKAAEKNRDIQNLYQICETGYGYLIDEFTDANFAFIERDYGSILFYVEKCERFVNDCQNVLGNKVPKLSALNLQNRVLVKMALVSAGLIKTTSP